MNKFAILSVVAAVAAVAFLSMGPSTNSELESKFGDFLAQYGRSYNSQSEYEFRLNVFGQNLERAEKMNQASPLATFGVTQFSDWTDAEFNAILGERDEFETGKTCTYSDDVTEVAAARDPIDLRNLFQPVQNQKSCGSCWSFAATATFEAYWKNVKGESVKGSEQFLVDCDKNDSGCNGGLANTAYVYLSDNAFVTEDSYEYTARDEECKASGKPTIGKTGGCQAIPRYNEDAIYNQVATATSGKGGPVSISVDASVWHSYTGGILTASECGTATNHAVVIVGYGTEGGQDYWVVRNSWSSDWGEQGYIRLAADQNTCALGKRPGFPIIE